MRKILFIVNPISGKGSAKKVIPIIKNSFKDFDMDMKITKFVGDATNIASLNASKYTDIISVGGDGTLKEVLDGLMYYKGNVGIIPCGTGNDFIRSLDLSNSIDKCVDVIKQNKAKKVDVLLVNEQPYINIASFGVDGDVIVGTDKIKHMITGTPAYALSAINSISKFKPYKVTMQIDNKIIEREIAIVAVSNGMYFGGGMKISPLSNLDDGLLDVTIANKTNRLKLISLFKKLFKAQHMNSNIVEHYKCKYFKIESNQEIRINADGNLIGKIPAEIKLADYQINILIP